MILYSHGPAPHPCPGSLCYCRELRGSCCLQLSVDLAFAEVAERKLTVEEEEAKRIAEMGKPILGEHPKLEVIIEESYEFKVSGCPRGPAGGRRCVAVKICHGRQG